MVEHLTFNQVVRSSSLRQTTKHIEGNAGKKANKILEPYGSIIIRRNSKYLPFISLTKLGAERELVLN